jgi:hypothetical protein
MRSRPRIEHADRMEGGWAQPEVTGDEQSVDPIADAT